MGVCSTRVHAGFFSGWKKKGQRLCPPIEFQRSAVQDCRLPGSLLCAFQLLDKQAESFVCIHCTKSNTFPVGAGTPAILPFVSELVSDIYGQHHRHREDTVRLENLSW